LISFDNGSMDHFPEQDWPAVGESAHAVEAMIDKIHAAPTHDGMPRLRYPGKRADQDYLAARTRGILLHPVLAQELTQMGEELGVPFAPVYRE
jgi:LDH2 family malate/lactate/ureidoglycolate dehydrogenase